MALSSGLACRQRTLASVSAAGPDAVPYVLELAASPGPAPHLAALLSGGAVKLFDAATLSPLGGGPLLPQALRGARAVAWLPDSGASLLAVGCGAAVEAAEEEEASPGAPAATAPPPPAVLLVDLRAPGGRTQVVLAAPVLADVGGGARRLSSLAVSPGDGRLLATGLGARVAVFDLRRAAAAADGDPRGGALVALYEESHSEPVSQLQFHPELAGHLLSGADDGLVCVFDTARQGEDEALVAVLSAGSSVKRFGAFGPRGAHVHVISRTEGLSLWNVGSAERVADFSSLHSQLLEQRAGLDFLVDCHFYGEGGGGGGGGGRLACLAGNDDGALAVLEVSPAGVALGARLPAANGHSAAVRAACWLGDAFVTGGEDGMLCAWASEGGASIAGAASKPVMRREREEGGRHLADSHMR